MHLAAVKPLVQIAPSKLLASSVSLFCPSEPWKTEVKPPLKVKGITSFFGARGCFTRGHLFLYMAVLSVRPSVVWSPIGLGPSTGRKGEASPCGPF